MTEEEADKIKLSFQRKAAALTELISKREKDLERLKAQGTSKTLIDNIDHEIDVMVNFYNQTEKLTETLIQISRVESVTLKSEIHIRDAIIKNLKDFISELLSNNVECQDQFINSILKGKPNGPSKKKIGIKEIGSTAGSEGKGE